MGRKRISLRTRVILLVSLFMLATNLALGYVLVRQARSAAMTQMGERMLDIVNTAAAMLDGDVLERLRAEDAGTPEPAGAPPPWTRSPMRTPGAGSTAPSVPCSIPRGRWPGW